MSNPVCVDLYCGLGGWAEGFLAEGYEVIGYDIERHEYDEHKYPGTLILKDVLDITAAEIRALNPQIIVASPPCTEPSYRAMPWSRAKALNCKPPSTFLCLFYACFKIAHDVGVPVIVENVRGAQPWVGPAAWHYGSFYLWGDLPALMPMPFRGIKNPGLDWSSPDKDERKCFRDTALKNTGGSWFAIGSHGQKVTGQNPDGRKLGGAAYQEGAVMPAGTGRTSWFFGNTKHELRATSAGGKRRKAASAMIAKIPFPLASHIARCLR